MAPGSTHSRGLLLGDVASANRHQPAYCQWTVTAELAIVWGANTQPDTRPWALSGTYATIVF